MTEPGEQSKPQMTPQQMADIIGHIEDAGGTVERVERITRTTDPADDEDD